MQQSKRPSVTPRATYLLDPPVVDAVLHRQTLPLPVDGEAEACENCGTPLHGRYCARCGQDAVEPVAPLREVVARGLSDVLALDLRYPRTIWALLVPGRLPDLYLSGHRVPFVPPLRFALSASLILLVVVALRLPSADALTVGSGLPGDLAFMASGHPLLLTVAWLLTLPAFAAVLWAVFRRATPLYLSHLTFALYFHGAFALALAALFALSFVAGLSVVSNVGLVALGWVAGPHLALGLRRVHGRPWWRVLLGWGLGASAYVVLFALAFGLAVGAVALAGVLGAV